MGNGSRREFLQKAGAAGLVTTGKTFWPFPRGIQSGSSSAGYQVEIDPRRVVAPLDRKIFGSFLEHLGRAIYEGIYAPGSKLADSNGFRSDTLEEIRTLSVPIVRYPGGNFVSGYSWLDGVGPVQDRPRILEKAWNSVETNQFGTNEFLHWCKAVGTEPLLAVNLGTGTPEGAAALLEYCNVDKGTKWSDLRRNHGFEAPYGVSHWCLGNEMDGPWQTGHMSATAYGEKAADAARQMRYVDPSVKLIACGSSNASMPTYLLWDREVLEQCYDYVDAISLHRYFDNSKETGGDSSKFLALNLSMERQISEIKAVCDYVRGRTNSTKTLWLSFDEWNVWYRARSGSAVNGNRETAPHLLEEVYNLEDALLVGGLINSLIRNSDRVRIGCLAQLVNVIAPLMTDANGFYRQTIYYPYSWALAYAKGKVLNVLVDNGPTYEVAPFGDVPYVDVAGTFDAQTATTTLLLLNRDLHKPQEIELTGSFGSKLLTSLTLTGNDLKASNGFDAPKRVVPQSAATPLAKRASTTIELPPRSYSVYQWKS